VTARISWPKGEGARVRSTRMPPALSKLIAIIPREQDEDSPKLAVFATERDEGTKIEGGKEEQTGASRGRATTVEERRRRLVINFRDPPASTVVATSRRRG